MKKIIFLNLILHFFIPPIAYANTQIANSFNTAFKQWASDNNWGTGICQISKEEIKLMYFEYTNANKIISSVGRKCKTKSTNTDTQPEQPITDSTTNDIQPSEMSTADACAYWNGIITSDNKCMGTSGYLWEAQWNDDTKSFSCVLKVVIYQQKQPEQTKLINIYRNATYDSSGQPYDYVSNLQWDKNLQKCTSAPERQCISDGNTYDTDNWICLSHKYDQEKCEAIGGIFSMANNISNCDCIIGNKSFHWDSDGNCQYTTTTGSNSSTQEFVSTETKYAEECIYRNLRNTELFNGSIKKLDCKNN